MRGRILHHHSAIAGKTKFFVVLNHAWPPADGRVIYAFLTSNVERVTRLSASKCPVVILPPGSYPCCKLETAIDLTQIIDEPFADVSTAESYKEVATLTKSDLLAVLDAVKRSTIITRMVKKRIIGEA